MKALITLAMLAALSAQAQAFEGQYSHPIGMTYNFKPDGKVIQIMRHSQTEMPYEVRGDTIQIYGEEGTWFLKIKGKEKLQSQMGEFTKKL